MTPNDGGAAFPHCAVDYATTEHGMSLRDWFAGMALQGLLASRPYYRAEEGSMTATSFVSTWAYAYAEAMLKQRGTP